MEFGRDKQPERRLKDCGNEFLAPCQDPKRGCPKGTPENPRNLLLCNELAYEHYRECRAVGEFPDDPIVRRNAAIIRAVEDEIELRKVNEFRHTMIAMIGVKSV